MKPSASEPQGWAQLFSVGQAGCVKRREKGGGDGTPHQQGEANSGWLLVCLAIYPSVCISACLSALLACLPAQKGAQHSSQRGLGRTVTGTRCASATTSPPPPSPCCPCSLLSVATPAFPPVTLPHAPVYSTGINLIAGLYTRCIVANTLGQTEVQLLRSQMQRRAAPTIRSRTTVLDTPV